MAKKLTNSSEKEERKVKYRDAFKPNIEQKPDAVKSQQYVKKKIPEKIELTQEQVWDLKRPKYVLYDTKEKPSSDTRTSALRNADYWDPIKGASERNKSKMDNGKHPILGLAKTVGTSALIATGALELPALATWGGLGSRALVGGAQGLGYGMLGMGTGNPVNDFTYGAMGEVGIPLVGNMIKSGKNLIKPVSKLVSKTDDVVKPAISIADDVSKQTHKTTWQLEELPGLHLKSTMEGEAISKIVEPKTGLINVEQALGIIGKESGGADKVALIKKGLGENIPKKMDYNEFRKVVQDQLIPLERQFSTKRSDYGIHNIGYGNYGGNKVKLTDVDPKDYMPEVEKWLSENPSVEGVKFKSIRDTFEGQGTLIVKGTKPDGTDFDWIISKSDLPSFVKKEKILMPLENQTLILGNKNKFGRGSNAHGNPDETLGHIHFLRDAKTPDVLTVTQIQSDAFQGTHRTMPKTQQEALEKVNELKKEGIEIKSIFGDGKESSNAVLANYEKHLQLDEASAKNFTQKQLLDKNHQERYLQELVDYAGKRGDVSKVRVPTSETAAKVQGYKQTDYDIVFRELEDLRKGNISDVTKLSSETKSIITVQGNTSLVDISGGTFTPRNYKDVLSDLDKNKDFDRFLESRKGMNGYEPEYQTILKKYSEQPKTIKKLFGVEPKIVTDSKGNTWYEFDIPESFRKGKAEIKALSTIGAVATGTVATGKTIINNETKYAYGGNMKYTSLFKLGGAAKILLTGGTSPNPWRKVSGSFNGVNYQGEVLSDKSKTNPSLGYVIYKDNNGKKFSRDLEGVITYDPKSTTQDSIAFQSILNNNGFNYGKGPATQSLDLLNSKMKEMKDDPWFKERGQKK